MPDNNKNEKPERLDGKPIESFLFSLPLARYRSRIGLAIHLVGGSAFLREL